MKQAFSLFLIIEHDVALNQTTSGVSCCHGSMNLIGKYSLD